MFTRGFLSSNVMTIFGTLPDRIVVFRQPHLGMGLNEEELKAEIRKTVLHELGHHLGIDDTRLAELGWA